MKIRTLILAMALLAAALLLIAAPDNVRGGEPQAFTMWNYLGTDEGEGLCPAHSTSRELEDEDFEPTSCEGFALAGSFCVSGTSHEPPQSSWVPNEVLNDPHPEEEGQCGGSS